MNEKVEELFSILQINRIFQGLNEQQLLKVVMLMREIEFLSEEIVVQEGDIAEDFYVIKTGSVEVMKINPTSGVNHLLATLVEGDCIGEIAFVENSPHATRSASIRTLEPTTLLAVSMEKLRAELNDATYNIILVNLGRILGKRLRHSNESTIKKSDDQK